MTDADVAALTEWATAHAPEGYLQAAQCLRLLAELKDARDRDAFRVLELADTDAALADAQRRLAEARDALAVKDELILGLSERVLAQSELLGKRAERAEA